MKRGILYVVLLTICAIPLHLPKTYAQDAETACYDAGKIWDYETQECIVFSGMVIDIQYPIEYAAYPFAKAAIDEFIAELEDYYFSFMLDDSDLAFFIPYAWEAIATYTIYDLNPSIQTLVYNLYDYTGGAHGNGYYFTMTFDLENERILSLEDVFAPNANFLPTISALVRADLSARLVEMSDPEWIASGTSENIDNYQDFVLTPEGILFLFEPYQVAAYAAGPQESLVSWDALDGLVADNIVPTPSTREATVVDEQSCLNVNMIFDYESQACKFYKGYIYRAVYPLELANAPAALAIVDEFLAQQEAELLAFMTSEEWQLFLPAPHESHSTYTLTHYDDNIFTLVYETYTYTDGVEGDFYYTTFTFDQDGQLLTLEDVFLPNADIVSIVAPLIDAQLSAYGLGWVDENARNDLNSYRNFALLPQGIQFFLDPDEVGASVEGSPQILIEWEALNGTTQFGA